MTARHAALRAPIRHVVWDWNGTLCDDLDLVLAALNATVRGLGVPEVSAERYRLLYTRPVRGFYDRLVGRPVTDAEWRAIDRRFHEAYLERLSDARLAPDAFAALDRADAAGASQSLLSMFHHRHLVPLVRRLGVHDRFVRVDGVRGPGGGLKQRHLVRHLGSVLHHHRAAADSVLVVGDALDDATAARHVGARCVLYDGGTHPRAELEAAGVPVACTLVGALEAALGG